MRLLVNYSVSDYMWLCYKFYLISCDLSTKPTGHSHVSEYSVTNVDTSFISETPVYSHITALNFNRLTQFSLPWLLSTNELVVSTLHCIIKTKTNLYGTTFASNLLRRKMPKSYIIYCEFCIVHGYDFREVFQKAVFNGTRTCMQQS